MKTLVLGIGNTLLSDEGVGVHALKFLKKQLNPSSTNSVVDRYNNIRLLDGGTLSFTLATEIEQSQQLIVIDAAELDAEPGKVKLFVDDDMDQFLGAKRPSSVHEVNLLDLLSMSRLSGHFPVRRALIAIQPQSVDWGDTPTAAVAQAIPRVCDYVLAQLQSWQS